MNNEYHGDTFWGHNHMAILRGAGHSFFFLRVHS